MQARMSSSRLPGKIILPLCDKPLLVRMLERVCRATELTQVAVATSLNVEDDKIEQICKEYGYDVFRGHPLDLLDRHYQAAKKYEADIVLKIPSDCPLIDPTIIDQVVNYYQENAAKFDYVSNLHPPSFPDGNDVEVMSFAALEKAWQHATRPMEREHTTPYIWENPEQFKIGNVKWKTGFDYSMTHRWTIDYQEDYLLIKEIFETLYPEKPEFTLYDILDLLQEQLHLNSINERYNGVNWYRHHLDELKTIGKDQTRFVTT